MQWVILVLTISVKIFEFCPFRATAKRFGLSYNIIPPWSPPLFLFGCFLKFVLHVEEMNPGHSVLQIQTCFLSWRIYGQREARQIFEKAATVLQILCNGDPNITRYFIRSSFVTSFIAAFVE
jgi:hypothetical protein